VNKKTNNLKYKLYQMFILGMDGTELISNPNLINALENGLGGVIFFTQNIKTIEQISNLTTEIKSRCEIPPFLSIDQEGGRVERTENIFKQQSRLGILAQQHKTLNTLSNKFFLSAKFAAEKGESFLKEQTKQISQLLKEMGMNLNFAPVLDVNTNPNNPIIGERAFSNTTDEVIKFGEISVDTYLENGIIPCTKHFPGHGDASADSHISLPKIDLSLAEMEKYHIKPFKEVYSPMIMVAHLHCTAFDKKEIPSSLSKNVINYLRQELNYDGVTISDDMVMGGVVNAKCIEGIGNEEWKMENGKWKMDTKPITLSPDNLITHSSQAIKAGINILLYRNSYNETIQIIEELAQLAEKDTELRENIEKSYDKIIKLKNDYNLLN